MKIKILFLLVLVLALDLRADTNGTPVYFSLRQLTGLANATRFALVPDARQNPVTDGTNLFGSFPIITNAPGGVRTIYLQPIGYTLTVPGWSRSLHLVIPDTTNTVNAVNCITNGLPTLNSATVLGLQSVSVSNSPTVTWTGNGTSTNPLTAEIRGFTGTVTNLASVPFQIAVTTNGSQTIITTNLVFLGFFSAFYQLNGTYQYVNTNLNILPGAVPGVYYQNGYWIYPDPDFDNVFADQMYVAQYPFTNFIARGSITYGQFYAVDNTPILGTASFSYTTNTIPILATNVVALADTFHFNLTTFTNGACITNIVQ